MSDKSRQSEPHPRDVPLDPVHHRAEFDAVLTDWVSRQDGWRIARWRYLECLRKGIDYGPERLVAAANMFDILPPAAVPVPADLPRDLAAARNTCVAVLSACPRGIDRDSALSALGRLGKPSLPKKLAYRASIVASKLGSQFPDLHLVSRVAVQCRNYFVHGSSGDIDFEKVELFVPFLTDALEFIFAASDFVEAGWDAQRWHAEPMGWGHSFARFRSEYNSALADLQRALSA